MTMSALAILDMPASTALGLGPIDGIDEWRRTGECLASAHKAVNWLIGDWWNAGEPYGDRVAEAARIFPHLSHQAMRDFGWIAGKFDVSRRHDTIDWSLYREVAPISETPAADRLLALAGENRWTVQAIREHVAEHRERIVPRWLQTREMPSFNRDEAKSQILACLTAAAEKGDICPTADELQEISGVGSVATTVALMHVLEEEGAIKVDRYQRSRKVTILATGQSTAQPNDTSPHWRERPRELPAPTVAAIQRDRPTIAAEIFARAKAKGRSPQEYLTDLVWLGWEVECAIDSAGDAAAARAA